MVKVERFDGITIASGLVGQHETQLWHGVEQINHGLAELPCQGRFASEQDHPKPWVVDQGEQGISASNGGFRLGPLGMDHSLLVRFVCHEQSDLPLNLSHLEPFDVHDLFEEWQPI